MQNIIPMSAKEVVLNHVIYATPFVGLSVFLNRVGFDGHIVHELPKIESDMKHALIYIISNIALACLGFLMVMGYFQSSPMLSCSCVLYGTINAFCASKFLSVRSDHYSVALHALKMGRE